MTLMYRYKQGNIVIELTPHEAAAIVTQIEKDDASSFGSYKAITAPTRRALEKLKQASGNEKERKNFRL